MHLALFEQQIKDVRAQFQRPRQTNPVGRRGAGWWFANFQRNALPDGDDVGDWGLAIKYSDGLAAANSAEIFAEMGFEFRNADLLHDYMMTISDLVATN
jgi:hypothetical protein